MAPVGTVKNPPVPEITVCDFELVNTRSVLSVDASPCGSKVDEDLLELPVEVMPIPGVCFGISVSVTLVLPEVCRPVPTAVAESARESVPIVLPL